MRVIRIGRYPAQATVRACLITFVGGLPCTGQYNEQVFKSIDYILDQMSQNGIRVIVALIDYWKKTDGVEQVRPLLPVQYIYVADTPTARGKGPSSRCREAGMSCCLVAGQFGEARRHSGVF